MSSRRNPTLSLPAIGLVAGILTVCSFHFFGLPVPGSANPLIGLYFGGLIGIQLWIFKKIRAWQILLLILSSGGAYAIALLSFDFEDTLLARFQAPGFIAAPPTFFIPGMLGAFVILGAVFFLVSPAKPWWHILRKALGWSIGGGVLGAVGWTLGPWVGLFLVATLNYLHMGSAAEPGNMPGANLAALEYSVHLIWQTGMGFLLALSLARDYAAVPTDKEASVTNKKTFPVAATIFFVVVFLPLVMMALGQHHDETRTRKGVAKCISEEPPAENLPDFERVSYSRDEAVIEQALITQAPAPYVAKQATFQSGSGYKFHDQTTGMFRHIPPTETYHVAYERPEVTKYLAGSSASYATVTQYPNTEWAKYQLENSAEFCIAAFYPERLKYVKKVTRKGRNILMYSPSGGRDWHFYWTAGNTVVAVHYNFAEVAENDPLLEAYLKKYPSSVAP